MLRRVLASLTALSTLASPALAESVEEVLARAVQARGGLEKLRAVQTVRMTGRMSMGTGPEVPIRIERKRPRQSRLEMTIQGLTGVQAFDGQKAWGIPPVPDAKPEALPAEMARGLESEGDLDGPLVDHEAKGHEIRLVGREKLDGADAWKLELKLKSGDVRHVFLDATSYLEIRSESRRVVQGSEIVGESRFSDYRESGGVLWPHTVEVGPKGRPEKQLLRFDKVEVNLPLEDAHFKMPRP